MQSVEEFMTCMFAARTETLKKEALVRLPYRRRYFSEECLWDSRMSSVEGSEAEKVLDIWVDESDAKVITSGHSIIYSTELRYHLVRKDDSWLIRNVEHECKLCKNAALAFNNRQCPCRGTGWLSTETFRK